MNHHYLPVCYLKRWANRSTGKLVEFSRPHDSVKALRRAPRGAGFVTDLYRIAGAEVGSENAFEIHFLSIIDNTAARTLDKIIGGGGELSPEERERWMHFVLSLMARCPMSVATLKDVFESYMRDRQAEIAAEVARLAAEHGHEHESRSLDDTLPEQACKVALSMVKTFITHPDVCGLIRRMHWLRLPFDDRCEPLLTSDRPVLMTNGLDRPNGQLILPLSPKVAFGAFRFRDEADRVRRLPLPDLAKDINRWTVEQAVSFVYGPNDAARPFVERYMGRRRVDLYVDYRRPDRTAHTMKGNA